MFVAVIQLLVIIQNYLLFDRERRQDANIVDLMSSTGFELSPASYVNKLQHSTSHENQAFDDYDER